MATLQDIRIASDGIGHLLSDNRLQVPPYQREYKWKKAHVQELFDDLSRAVDEGKKDYFLGSIVACASDDELLEIVDGQQRLATTAILLAAIRDYLIEIDQEAAAQNLSRDYLLRTHGIKNQKVYPNLSLGECDNEYFSSRILGFENGRTKPKPARPSHRLIDSAATVASAHVRNITAGRPKPDQLTILDKWVEFIDKKAKIVFITVPDPADAFVIFETLNDRGLELSIADLTKNYLFAQSQKRIEETKHNWNRMIGMLEAVSSSDITKYYIHTMWSSHHGVTRNRELFSRMRDQIYGEQRAVEFSSVLASGAYHYAALRIGDHEYWNTFGLETKQCIHILNHLRVAQIRMLLLAVLGEFSQNATSKVISESVCWSVRFLIAGGATGRLEAVYAKSAVRIRKKEIRNEEELFRYMANEVPDDEMFRTAFASETASANYLARYYLGCLEKCINRDERAYLGLENEKVGSLEHILPISPDKAFWKLDDDEVARLRYRIGNLALIADSKNSKRGNGSFDEAKKVYSDSKFALTRSIAQFLVWDENSIDQRQEELAKLAIKAWPLTLT